MQIALLIFCALVVLEFGVHVIYYAMTGKAGLYDPAFSYLKDIFKRKKTLVERIKEVYLTEDTPVMSELCLWFKNELTFREIQELLEWSGDDEYVRVLPNKDIVMREV